MDLTDHTFNPWVGCEKVSPGCAHCYAETLVTGRMSRPGTWGADGVRERTSASTWAAPHRYERNAARFAEENGRRQRVFCASLADVFEPRPELEEWRLELFRDVISMTPSLDWLVLTKRPDVARDWLRKWHALDEPDVLDDGPHENLWLGVSIENSRHTWRADILREIPAAVRFISAEPLLGSLFQISGRDPVEVLPSDPRAGSQAGLNGPGGSPTSRPERAPLDLSGIDWIIVGGESGGKTARPMQPEWAREIRDACAARCRGLYRPGPAFLFKQWGSWVPSLGGSMTYAGSGPKSGGRLLDGREWTEFPR